MKAKGTIEIVNYNGYYRWREYWGDFGSNSESKGFKTINECREDLKKHNLKETEVLSHD